MNVSEEEFQYMKKHLITELVSVIVEQEHLTTEEALKKIYTSELFKKSTIPILDCFFKALDTFTLISNKKRQPIGLPFSKDISLLFFVHFLENFCNICSKVIHLNNHSSLVTA